MPSTLAADASPQFRTVAEAVVATMRQVLVPGVAIGLLTGDGEEHATFGVESLSSMNPVTPETLFQIGSVTKTFTATAIWRLIDEGALDLDAPLRTYIPDFTVMDADASAQVTIGNLLDHSAGWYGDEGFDTGEGDDALARYVAERLPQLPQNFPLGELFSYNNAAFTTLGYLMEVVTGTTYQVALQNLVLGPLGLGDTLLERAAVTSGHYSDGHVALPINGRVAATVQTPLWLPRSVDPAGSLWSTTYDLIRYARFHIASTTAAGTGNIVQPESLALMQAPSIDIPGTEVRMGKNWFSQDIDGIRAIYHGGDTLGQHALLVMVPEHNFALAVLTNGQGGGGQVASTALDAAFSQVPQLASLAGRIGLVNSLRAPTDAPTLDLEEAQLDEYAGRYADLGEAFILARTDEGLEMSHESISQPGVLTSAITPPPGQPARVTFLAGDQAVVNQAQLPFIRNAAGEIGWLSAGLRLLPRMDPES